MERYVDAAQRRCGHTFRNGDTVLSVNTRRRQACDKAIEAVRQHAFRCRELVADLGQQQKWSELGIESVNQSTENKRRLTYIASAHVLLPLDIPIHDLEHQTSACTDVLNNLHEPGLGEGYRLVSAFCSYEGRVTYLARFSTD